MAGTPFLRTVLLPIYNSLPFNGNIKEISEVSVVDTSLNRFLKCQ